MRRTLLTWGSLAATMLACAQPSVRPLNQPKYANPKMAQIPCWVEKPTCVAKADDGSLFFTGQSDRPIPNWGFPSQESTQSALVDAEHQYARFLGVEIQSSLFLQQLFNNGDENERFEQNIATKVVKTISAVQQIDKFGVAYQETSEGQPIWTVYILIQIPAERVKEHQAAVAAELKARQNKPPPATKWTVELFNIDDIAKVWVNDTQVLQCGFTRTCRLTLSDHFTVGKNTVRLEFGNRFGFWTYGYEVKKNQTMMYNAKCGQVWVFGCDWDVSRGVKHRLKFDVEWSPNERSTPSTK